MTLGLVAFGLLACVLAYFSPHLARVRAEALLRARCRRERALALSYDDGPGPELLPRLLELLAEYGARASFFPLGRRVELHPELLDRLTAAGHEVGCHSQLHHNAWRSSPLRASADVRQGFRTLAPWLGARPLFRPPHGKLTLTSWLTGLRRGARLAFWTCDSGDTHETLPGADAPDALEAELCLAGGGVVLLHDFDREPERAEYVLRVTRRLLELARREGLRIVPVGELLAPATPRVLAVASGGGHWIQLLRLRSAFECCDVAFVTVERGYREGLPASSRFYVVRDATRWDRLALVVLVLQLAWIVVRERPHVVISTGAAPGVLALALARALGSRTIWIDSIANAEQLSLSGQQARRYADLWLTQWPHLAQEGGPRFEGSVL